MNIRKLEIFYATATSLNMTKVAKQLYISQPSVSQVIHELEHEFNVKLFDRIGKKIYLTDAGEIYLNYVRRILNLHEEANETMLNLGNRDTGKLRIGASTTIGIYLLPDLIGSFIENHKNVEISLMIENTKMIEQMICENKVDVGFIEGEIISKELIKNKICDDEIILLCNKKHPFYGKDTISAKQLQQEKLIIREEGSGTRDAINKVLQEYHLENSIFMELGNPEAIIKSVEANLGIGCLSFHCIASKLEKEELKALRIENIEMKRDLSMIYHKDKYINQNMARFMEFIKNTYK